MHILHMHADFTSTSELPFASLERVLVLNVSHENDLIFMQMNIQVTYIFIPIVLHKDLFCYRGKSKLGIGLFIHELLREPLINTKHALFMYALNAEILKLQCGTGSLDLDDQRPSYKTLYNRVCA